MASLPRGTKPVTGSAQASATAAPPPGVGDVDVPRELAAAVAANAAKSRYLATLSHEIRSPLNVIYGYAQLIEHGSCVDSVEASRVIRRSCEHLIDLVEGLLDISQVENGVTRVARDVVRLPAFLDQIAEMFIPDARAKGLAFDLVTEGNVPEFVRTDQKRLRQVLINLVGNAIKYTGEGSVTLRVRCTGEVAQIEVRDTGPGIAAADRDRIFSPFERGVDGGGGGANGFGLGLAITQAMVHILGGDIALDSTPGKGSCFRVRLMLPRVSVDGGVAPRAARIIGYAGPRRSILAVDDDVRQLAFLRQALTDLGFEVAAVPDGEAAIALCAAQDFDLALLDIRLARESGWDLAAALRRAHGTGLRIVMLSANAHEQHGPPGEPAHDLFLLKPVELGAMIDAIGRQLGIEWQREARATELTDKRTAPAPEATTTDAALPEAARVHLDVLRESVRTGHVRAVEAGIKALAEAAPDAGPLIDALYRCLDRFDMPALARRLEGL